MRTGIAAGLAGVDPDQLRKWMAAGLVKYTHTGRERAIHNSELPILKDVVLLIEAGFTDKAAFEIARAKSTTPARRSQVNNAKVWSLPLTDTIRVAIVEPHTSQAQTG